MLPIESEEMEGCCLKYGAIARSGSALAWDEKKLVRIHSSLLNGY